MRKGILALRRYASWVVHTGLKWRVKGPAMCVGVGVGVNIYTQTGNCLSERSPDEEPNSERVRGCERALADFGSIWCLCIGP